MHELMACTASVLILCLFITQAAAGTNTFIEAAYCERKISEYTSEEYTEEEAEAFLDTFQSAGRKGLKLPRINMAFSPENYEYIRRMARARGETLTTCLNWMIKEHRDQNQDTYQKILEFLETL